MISSVQNLLLLTVDPKDMGLASSLNTVFRNLGNSMGAPIAGSIMSTFTFSLLVGHSSTGSEIYKSFPSAAVFQYSFSIAAVAFLLIALVVLFAHEVLGKNRRANANEKKFPHK
jgi:large-conductance mechanosensitive channel